ncbi:MAG: NAD(P)-dependent oxidoreductase [Dehalococcoidales bacterium]|nr:NAD(P)-dependent oxidoreductase [Dehalococcoidales bacterium]
MDIGFIGIGQMGKHMSRRILEAGYNLTVHDLKKEAAAPLLERGARWGDTPGDVARACRVVISSLPTPQDVEQVVYGTNGLKSGWKAGDIYIDMSTNSPSTIRRIAEDAKTMEVAVLDAPVSGGTKAAETGTLAIMVGGDSASLERVRKVLETMGQRIFPVGDAGCGNITKLVNNMISLACNSISAEGFVLGAKAGINPGVLLEIIKISTGNNWCAQQYPNTVFKGNFEPGFKVGLAYKDISLALDLGKEYGVPLPIGAAVQKDLQDTIAAGFEDKGVDAVILTLEDTVGVKVRLPE